MTNQKKKPLHKSNVDKGFTPDEMQKLIDYKLLPPSQILKSHIDESININDHNKDREKNSKISEERKEPKK